MTINEVFKGAGVDLSQWSQNNLMTIGKGWLNNFSLGAFLNQMIAVTRPELSNIIQTSINAIKWYEASSDEYEELNAYFDLALSSWFIELQNAVFKQEMFIQLLENGGPLAIFKTFAETETRSKDFTKKETENQNTNANQTSKDNILTANSVNNFNDANTINNAENIDITKDVNISKLNKSENDTVQTHAAKSDKSVNYEDKENENVTHIHNLEVAKFLKDFLSENYESLALKLKTRLLKELVSFYCF